MIVYSIGINEFGFFIICKILFFEQVVIVENDKKNGQIYYEMYWKG